MTKSKEIKFHSAQKTKKIKSTKRNKYIGILTTCASAATIIATCASMLNEQSNWTNDATYCRLGGCGLLLGIMFLRMSNIELKAAQWHQKQIRRIQKQK